MPRLAVLAAATQIRDGVYPAFLQQHEVGRIECRRQADVEPAIAGQKDGTIAVPWQSLPPDEEHRNARAVPGGIPDLGCFILIGIELHTAIAKRRELIRPEIVAIVHGGVYERRESEEHLVVFGTTADAGEGAKFGQLELAGGYAGELEKMQLVARVVHVNRNEHAVDHSRGREFVQLLRNDFDRCEPRRVEWTSPDDSPARRAFVGAK